MIHEIHDLKRVTCKIPYMQFHVTLDGVITLCCDTWMPFSPGNINDFTILEYIKSPEYRKLLETFTDGSFSYCDKSVCPEIQSYLHTGKSRFIVPLSEFKKEHIINIQLNYDQSCNLRCPSCRPDLRLYTSYPPRMINTHEQTLKSISELLEAGYHVYISVTGAGDPFASKLYSDFLKSYTHEKKNYSICIVTNGVMLTPSVMEWTNIKDHVNSFNISIDASTEKTYSIVRRGGNFSRLKSNLDHLNQKIKSNFFKKKSPSLKTNFIVSSLNFREMAEFAKWQINDYDQLTHTWYNLIADWGHHPNSAAFDKLAVWKPTHPDHQEFLDILSDPIFKHPKVQLGNVSQFLDQR